MAAAQHDRALGAGVDPTEQLGLMRRVSLAMLLFGGLTCMTGVVITERTQSGKVWQAIWSVCFVAVGLVLLSTRPRLRVIQVATVLSILFLSGLMATSNPIGMGPFFYVWPIVFAAYFFSQRMLIAIFSLMVVTLGIGLALNATYMLKMDAFAGTVSTVGLMAALVAFMQQREHRLRENLAVVAHTDPLTGLLNRRAFNPELEALIADAIELGAAVSVVMLDIDHFKRFNDDHGHVAGDDALVRVADLLRQHSSEHDLVARFGGEEFAVALPGADAEGARRYAERVGRMLHNEAIDADLRVSVSAGIATLTPQLATLDALISHADDALYAAKNAGRARAAWWDGTIQIGNEVGRVAALAAG
jgi:diguanylate cyclase (GGDEF)-like protein